jgi:hypothetical protein
MVLECYYEYVSATNLMMGISHNASVNMQKMDKANPRYGIYSECEHSALFKCKQNEMLAKEFLFGNKKIDDPIGNQND